MMLLLFLWLSLPALLMGFLYMIGVRSRGRLIAAPLILFLLPFLAAALLYLFRTPVQQGKILSGMGPLLNIVFPAEDLYDPLVTVDLEPGINDYILSFSHKYVGRHAVEISSLREIQDPRSQTQNPGSGNTNQSRSDLGSWGTENDIGNLHVVLEVSLNGRVIYYAEQLKGSMFWGKDDHGLHFNTYLVPKNLPLGKELTARVTIRGDPDGYLEKHGAARLSITKMSDE